MDAQRDKICESLARRLNTMLYGDEANSDTQQDIWEWLESSDFTTEELETITLRELRDAWDQH